MELLFSPALVTGIISLGVIAVVALLRAQFGETEADRLIKLGGVAMNTARMIIRAAEIAVVEVEESLKRDGQLSNEELKNAAVKIAAELLAQWGIAVDQKLLYALMATVEEAYQRMKAAGQPDSTLLPV